MVIELLYILNTEANKMLETITGLVFYFDIQCANCKHHMKASHESIKDQQGILHCGLCGKEVRVPNYENLVKTCEDMNKYLSSPINSQYITLELNEKYVKGAQ